MATQFRRNVEHFGTALAQDKAVLDSVGKKLDVNYGFMTAQRTKLKDYSVKGKGTTWLVFLSVIIVAVAWVAMMFLIRITRF